MQQKGAISRPFLTRLEFQLVGIAVPVAGIARVRLAALVAATLVLGLAGIVRCWRAVLVVRRATAAAATSGVAPCRCPDDAAAAHNKGRCRQDCRQTTSHELSFPLSVSP